MRSSIRQALGMLSLGGVLMYSTAASAQASSDPVEPTDQPGWKTPTWDLHVGFRGVGEVWQDPAILTNYRSSVFGGAGFASLGLTQLIMAEIELGYSRLASDENRDGVAAGSLELVPLSALVYARHDTGRAEMFAGGGYAMVVFTERTTSTPVAGAKPGFDMRVGTRVHTDLIRPSMRPGAGGVQGLDVELMVGRRKHQPFGTGSGFDFSAWRLGIGLVARL